MLEMNFGVDFQANVDALTDCVDQSVVEQNKKSLGVPTKRDRFPFHARSIVQVCERELPHLGNDYGCLVWDHGSAVSFSSKHLTSISVMSSRDTCPCLALCMLDGP